jgi:glutamate formiminotransferase/glutamate formiminotransferase/formiminotetrahydrofolate cyclodeaminase
VAQFSLVEMTPPILLAVPNVSEGRDARTIAAVAEAFAARGEGRLSDGGTFSEGERAREGPPGGRVRLLDVHSDGDHHRSVFTLAGQPADLADALLCGAEAAVERIDVMKDASSRDRSVGDNPVEIGQHPYVGALDVAPIVYLDARARGAACAEALVVADRIGELGLPVFLYGELSGSDRVSGVPPSTQSSGLRAPAVTRADLRRGGVGGLAERMGAGELRPDFGPARMHPSAGATLVAARPPLVAFNLQLAPPATVKDARRIAALIREGGTEGLQGVRAIGVALRRGAAGASGSPAPPVASTAGASNVPGALANTGEVAQVSMNIERSLDVPLAMVIEAVRRHATVSSAELVGLAPRAALEGFPEDLPLPGFDPARHLIENALEHDREINHLG